MGMVRPPAVAGAFYPAHPGRLAALIAELLPRDVQKAEALGLLAPHAGYVYSGAAAGQTYARVVVPPVVILLGPNHTGRGHALALAAEDEWLTPLGKAPLDKELLADLAAADPDLAVDARAHAAEHSLEVQAPFLQALRPDVRLAPIVVGTHQLPELLRLGQALAEVIARRPSRPLIVISSDMTHYEPADVACAKDARALAWISAVDPVGLYKTVTEQSITMCGFAPAVAALEALRLLGATKGDQVVYTHSGVVTGDDREVVAYAGVVFRA